MREVVPPFVPRPADVEMGRYFDLDSEGAQLISLLKRLPASDLSRGALLPGASPWPGVQRVVGAAAAAVQASLRVQGAVAGKARAFASSPVTVPIKQGFAYA